MHYHQNFEDLSLNKFTNLQSSEKGVANQVIKFDSYL